ncbi:MAG: TRAP transporter substrate-binding protein DctP [Hyphomicrobium sp.]|uniref:TRAP transporter substrate-binding protein DctP n=1 Tax=Hyphomicrobium sp. CS1BSMeth3 TaxID=1892844 RepID=UPI00092FF60B|nr:TRAP transporter substrate-binding protein DctP [Hyphomicrobium sp. CS1BSMeth3]MBN9260545.1 TRAP transporter substrate-binding protein DctP [Hyphomicrobium sp.]MBN9268149.1 TRAP transporter substrate-binding protein DctP [Hyphomicrobium sp.]
MSLKYAAPLAAGALAALLGTGVTAQTVDGPAVNWNLSTWGKQRAFTAGMESVAKQLADRTGGKFQIKMHYGEALSRDRENLDGIKLGAFQVAHFCNFYHPGKNPAWMVFTLPFLDLGDWEIGTKVRIAMMKHPAFIKDMDQWNAMPYKSGLLPQYEFMGKGKPPETLEGWKGQRVRAGGGLGDAMKILGAVLSTVPATETYTGMERGTIDAVSLPYTYAHASYQLHTISNWFTNNMSPGTSECAAVINKDAYAALPPQYKKLLEEALPQGYKDQINAYVEIDKKNLPMFKAKLKEVLYSEAELKRFREVAGKPVWDKWVVDNKDKFDAQNVLDTLLAEIEKAKKEKK